MSIYFSTPIGVSRLRPLFNHVRVFVKQSDPFHTFENRLHPNVGSLMYNVYLSVPLPGWLFCTPEVDAPGGQTIQNRNSVRLSNIDHAVENLRVIAWRTSIGPWTSLINKYTVLMMNDEPPQTLSLLFSTTIKKNSNWKIFSRSCFFCYFHHSLHNFMISQHQISNHIITYK